MKGESVVREVEGEVGGEGGGRFGFGGLGVFL